MKCGCLAFIRFNSIKSNRLRVLFNYLPADFQAGQIPKRRALEIGSFFVEGD